MSDTFIWFCASCKNAVVVDSYGPPEFDCPVCGFPEHYKAGTIR